MVPSTFEFFVEDPDIVVRNFGSVEKVMFEMLADGNTDTIESVVTLEASNDLFVITTRSARGDADVERPVEDIVQIIFNKVNVFTDFV